MTLSAAIGVDLGGTNLKIAVVERTGRVREGIACETDTSQGPDRTIRQIVSEIDSLLARTSLKRSDLIGIGVGTPGPINIKEGRVIHAANLPGWRDVPLRDRLHDEFRCPTTLENDGNAAAFGEYWALSDGASAGDDLAMLTLGTGLGAGVVLAGRLLHGHFDNAAEFGHTIVVVNGLQCACGQRGCLEQYASASAVARRVVAEIKDGETSELSRDVKAGKSIDSEAVVASARAGDALCLRIWDEACLYLAVACINIQHAYNPARIVLGGGMSSAGSFLLDRVQTRLDEHKWSLHDDLPAITLSALGSDAGVIGAAALAWQAAGS